MTVMPEGLRVVCTEFEIPDFWNFVSLLVPKDLRVVCTESKIPELLEFCFDLNDTKPDKTESLYRIRCSYPENLVIATIHVSWAFLASFIVKYHVKLSVWHATG